MTPQQKANDLMSEYERIIRPLFKLNEYDIEKEYNKQCALKTVDEILKANPTDLLADPYEFYSSKGYWEQVKQALNKL